MSARVTIPLESAAKAQTETTLAMAHLRGQRA
nr:MAG TPA: hypothetical protein [Caudoviricetes sp.]